MVHKSIEMQVNSLNMQENVAPTVAFSAGISHKPPTIRSMSSYDE